METAGTMETTSSTDGFHRPIISAPVPENLIDQIYPPQEYVCRVIIRHPAYLDQQFAELLRVGLWLWHPSWDGFLTKDRNGSQRITDPDDSLLAHGVYFFHVSSATTRHL